MTEHFSDAIGEDHPGLPTTRDRNGPKNWPSSHIFRLMGSNSQRPLRQREGQLEQALE